MAFKEGCGLSGERETGSRDLGNKRKGRQCVLYRERILRGHPSLLQKGGKYLFSLFTLDRQKVIGLNCSMRDSN